jgi:hypothetical protein
MTALVPHPSTPAGAFGVAAAVERSGAAALRFTYRLVGSLAGVRVPAAASPCRADRLWEHTCFEAFVGLADAAEYVELNFAPSGAWAMHRFARYREGGPLMPGEVPPRIALERGPERLDLEATVALDAWPPAFGVAALHVGLTAVVETTDGRLSYWALRHPSATPDFHHADGFAIRLSACEERAS